MDRITIIVMLSMAESHGIFILWLSSNMTLMTERLCINPWGVWREGVLYDPSKLVIDSWYEYEYDINGNRVKETSYDEDGGIEYWYEYEYDSNGHRTKTTKNAADGSIIDE